MLKMSETTRRKLKGSYRKCDLISAHDLRRSFATNYYGKVQTPILPLDIEQGFLQQHELGLHRHIKGPGSVEKG